MIAKEEKKNNFDTPLQTYKFKFDFGNKKNLKIQFPGYELKRTCGEKVKRRED